MNFARVVAFYEEALHDTKAGVEACEILGDVLIEEGLAKHVLNVLFWSECLRDEIVCEAEDLTVLAGDLGRPSGRTKLFKFKYPDIRGTWLRAVLAVLLFSEWSEGPWYTEEVLPEVVPGEVAA